MRQESDERDDAEHLGQLLVRRLAPVHLPSAAEDGDQDMGVDVEVDGQENQNLHQHEDPHSLVVDVGEAGVVDWVQVMHAAHQRPLAHFLHQHGQEGEEHLLDQEELAVHQPAAAAHHGQVDGEGDEEDIVEGGRVGHVLGAHHELAEAFAEHPAPFDLPVDGEGPEEDVDQVADGAAEDENGHVVPDLAPPHPQHAGQERRQDQDVEGEPRHQEHDLRGGAQVQVGHDAAVRRQSMIHAEC